MGMADKEYIERDKAIDACFDGWDNNAHDCAENIRSIPAADVVPVVRCDDCINFTYGENESERWEWCILWGHDVSHDNYCSYGTKMDKDGSE